MPPLAPHVEKGCAGGRQTAQEVSAAAGLRRGPGQRSASFHGFGTEKQRHQMPKQRPKTQPDLLAGLRGRSFLSPENSCEPAPPARRTPSKVLVTVDVQRSLWPLHVMASAEWTVADLVAAAVGLYVKEGRRPLLLTAGPSDFGLHYSQFSLEKAGLDPREKVMELGSRSFFLCPKASAAGHAAASTSCSSDQASSVRDREAPAGAGAAPVWMSYMQFWPMM